MINKIFCKWFLAVSLIQLILSIFIYYIFIDFSIFYPGISTKLKISYLTFKKYHFYNIFNKDVLLTADFKIYLNNLNGSSVLNSLGFKSSIDFYNNNAYLKINKYRLIFDRLLKKEKDLFTKKEFYKKNYINILFPILITSFLISYFKNNLKYIYLFIYKLLIKIRN
jgi:hypothetical protein